MHVIIILSAVSAISLVASGACRHKPYHYSDVALIPDEISPTLVEPTKPSSSAEPVIIKTPIFEEPKEPVVEDFEKDIGINSSEGEEGYNTLDDTSHSSIATYYKGDISGGTCSFTTLNLPTGLTGVALPTAEWEDATHCGSCVKITGPKGNSIVAMVCFTSVFTQYRLSQTNYCSLFLESRLLTNVLPAL